MGQKGIKAGGKRKRPGDRRTYQDHVPLFQGAFAMDQLYERPPALILYHLFTGGSGVHGASKKYLLCADHEGYGRKV